MKKNSQDDTPKYNCNGYDYNCNSKQDLQKRNRICRNVHAPTKALPLDSYASELGNKKTLQTFNSSCRVALGVQGCWFWSARYSEFPKRTCETIRSTHLVTTTVWIAALALA
eukprot:1881761-Amphidinium_carterae.1